MTTKAQPKLEIKLNKSSDSLFYGMRNCLNLLQNGGKGIVSESQLDSCLQEAKRSKEAKEMFYSLLFSIGDITARQHNIFKKNKVDSGGNAQRDSFFTIVSWLKKKEYPQFKKFLFANLFNEYTSFDILLANRVQTTKKKTTITRVLNMLDGSPTVIDDLAEFITRIIKGSNPVDKYFVAKFLTRPRLSVRKDHKKMLPATKLIMKSREAFIKLVSEKANLPFSVKKGYIDFFGYYNWRKPYNGELESVLFSTGKINEFDKQEFLGWLEKLPSSARFRVRCRLLSDENQPKGTKWGKMPQWFLEWEAFKFQKQAEQRVLEEKVRQGSATKDDQTELVKIEKEAKVTVGAVNFQDMFKDIITGSIDKVKVQPFLDKVNLPYNTLTFIDDSGSMANTVHKDYKFSAFDMACFIATITLLKNPDDDGRSLLGFFSKSTRLYNVMTSKSERVNKLVTAKVVSTRRKNIVDPTLHFLDNLKEVRLFAESVRTGNGTNISSIPDYLAKQVKEDPEILEQLMAFPVWTIVSDGNWNNMISPEASMNDFMRRCENFLGFKPFVIAIDVSYHSASIERFSGIENFMYLPPNPAQIEQFLMNFKDIDVMDVYTPLQSIYRSNRYELVRKNVL